MLFFFKIDFGSYMADYERCSSLSSATNFKGKGVPTRVIAYVEELLLTCSYSLVYERSYASGLLYDQLRLNEKAKRAYFMHLKMQTK